MLFVDGATDGPLWHVGDFSAQLSVRLVVASRHEKESQRLVELQTVS